ncbi:hypothetical protein TNCT_40371 [Trichonephila clavata]|uniref:Uncharacterized protein n=1 Tax=Trichonephila clavata TaxID=2740835 RepID=A0A8X6HTR1_TRICU|nr:hypothetical protein TNCT_40371 [Trichonephila clavata]
MHPPYLLPTRATSLLKITARLTVTVIPDNDTDIARCPINKTVLLRKKRMQQIHKSRRLASLNDASPVPLWEDGSGKKIPGTYKRYKLKYL